MRTNEYEAMFLLENNAATADFEGTAGQVDEILTKHGAELVMKEKWDERKLAYEIKGQRRATYYLVYFRAPPASIDEVEVDLGLNEIVLRHLFIKLEEPIQVHVDKRAKERELLAEDSRKHSLSGWGRRDRRSKRDEKPAGPKPVTAEGDKPAAAEGDKPAAEAATPAAKSETPAADAPQADTVKAATEETT
ncbi:MAG: 30S ribosomal protein S6 [Planctomycetota bacterium]|nr:30S ribosomal protein S6 [Planctomycetota bacterium]